MAERRLKDEPKQVLIIRTDTDPKMRKGKMIAQGGHASLAPLLDMMDKDRVRMKDPEDGKGYYRLSLLVKDDSPLDRWLNIRFKKIVVKGTKAQLVEAYQEAKRNDIPCALIEDAGLTEFKGEITLTAVGIGPDDPDKIDKITENFELL